MPETHIRFISTTTIQPTKNYHENGLLEKIELTPWDLQFLFREPIQRGLLFKKSSCQISETNTNLIQHLKATLSSTLDTFYPLAGRLARILNHNNTSSFSLHCNGEGVEFIHAVADGIAVADILNAVNVPDDILHSFFPLNGVLNYEGIYKPLLAVQVTELLDGIFISCTMNHSVSDGTPFWNFFNTWSQISRGSNGDGDDHRQALQVSSQPPPLFAHRYLDGIIELPLRIPFEIPRTTFTPPPPIFQHRVFHFTKQTISQLKTKANAKMEIHNISSLQALLAHFWICVTRARNLKANQEVSLGIMIGMRSRLEPKYLAGEYIGNSCQPASVKTTAGELLKNGLGWVAWQINKIVSHTSGKARKLLQDWVKDPIMFKSAEITDNTTLSLGSSHRYNVYGNDFGWGRPIAVRSSRENMSDGKMTVFSGAEEGSIDFEVWLLPEIIQAMVNDAEFLNSITV